MIAWLWYTSGIHEHSIVQAIFPVTDGTGACAGDGYGWFSVTDTANLTLYLTTPPNGS